MHPGCFQDPNSEPKSGLNGPGRAADSCWNSLHHHCCRTASKTMLAVGQSASKCAGVPIAIEALPPSCNMQYYGKWFQVWHRTVSSSFKDLNGTLLTVATCCCNDTAHFLSLLQFITAGQCVVTVPSLHLTLHSFCTLLHITKFCSYWQTRKEGDQAEFVAIRGRRE